MERLYIRKEGRNGNHGSPRTESFPGSVILPESMLEQYLQNNGFVGLVIDESGDITEIIPDKTAQKVWKEAAPEEIINRAGVEKIRADVDYLAIMTGVDLD